VDPRAGLDNVERTFLILPELELWPLSCTARCQSLYWLCYPGSYRTDISQVKTKSNLLQIWLKMNNACRKSSCLEYNEQFYKTMIIKSHGMKISGRPRHTWDIKTNIVERACEGVDWTGPGQSSMAFHRCREFLNGWQLSISQESSLLN
jgi:hypothetical protein